MFLVAMHVCKISPVLLLLLFLFSCFLLVRFPGVPTGLQDENGVQYVFEVYESTDH